MGAFGPTGPIGRQGSQGIEGPTGPTATNGIDGTTGPTGAPGISAAGLNFNPPITLTGNDVLTIADSGCLIYCSPSVSGSYTITLPAATAIVAGSGFAFSVTTNSTWSFITTGTDTLDSYVPLMQGDRYCIVSDALNGWHEVYRTNATGTLVQAVRVITSGDVTMTATDCIIIVNKTTGAATAVTLPTTPGIGQSIVIKDGKGDAEVNNITISGAMIDAASSFVIYENHAAVSLIWNGSGWNII